VDNNVYVDPNKIDEFARSLNNLSSVSDKQMSLLLQALGGLGHTWKDQAFDDFQTHVRRLALTLLNFSESTDKFSRYLVEKAQQAREIHRLQPPGSNR
jgi:uncharacterized protein YukE